MNNNFDIEYADKLIEDERYEELFKYSRENTENSDFVAMRYLGLCYEYGMGIDTDEYMAFKCYLEASEHGDVISHKYVGLCYKNGTGVKIDEKTAVVYYKKAAECGDIEALRFLGISYEFGSGVKKDAFLAVEYYKRAADAGDIEALRCLGQCYANGTGVDKNLAFSFECYTQAANLGDDFSLFLLADCYHWGKGITVNYSEALNFYKEYIDNCKYADENYAKANYEIGNILKWEDVDITSLSTFGKEESYYKIAFDTYLKLSESGNESFYMEIAEMYEMGHGTQINYKKALEFYEKADLNNESSLALYRIGKAYENGKGVEKNHKKAFSIYRKAATHNPWIEAYIGLCYEYGIGTKKNIKKAIRIYEDILQRKKRDEAVVAANCLGMCYFHGKGVEKNIDKAVSLFKWCIPTGFAIGEYYIKYISGECTPDLLGINFEGGIFTDGFYVTQDYERAAFFHELYIKEVKDEKTILSELFLAKVYLKGLGVQKNTKKAVEFLVKCADESAIAMRLLGVCYFLGVGVKKDKTMAVKCFKKCADKNLTAKYYLAICYADGCGTIESHQNALLLLNELSQKKHKNAQALLGLYYLLGELGLEQDKSKADELFISAEPDERLRMSFSFFTKQKGGIKLLIKFLKLHVKREVFPNLNKLWLIKNIMPLIYYALTGYVLDALKKNKKDRTISSINSSVRDKKADMDYIQSTQEKILEQHPDLETRLRNMELNMSKQIDGMIHNNMMPSFEEVKKMVYDVLTEAKGISQKIDDLTQFIDTQLRATLLEGKSFLNELFEKNQIRTEEILEGYNEKAEQLITEFMQKQSTYINSQTQNMNELIEKEEIHLKSLFGYKWDKLDGITRASLRSAGVLWKGCDGITDPTFDYSGICISATSALELELKRCFYTGFQAFVKSKYGNPDFETWPESILSHSKDDFAYAEKRYVKYPSTNKKPILEEGDSFTIGSLPFLLGKYALSNIKNEQHKEEQENLLNARMEEYLSYIVKQTKYKNIRDIFNAGKNNFVSKCERIRKDYRNPAAHSNIILRKKAEECYLKIVGRFDALDYKEEVTSVLSLLYELVDIDKVSEILC